MDEDDFDPALARLDELMYGGEPPEPDCFTCWDGRSAGVFCPGCWPSPRQRRRFRHREWQRRDRESRAGAPLPVFDAPPF